MHIDSNLVFFFKIFLDGFLDVLSINSIKWHFEFHGNFKGRDIWELQGCDCIGMSKLAVVPGIVTKRMTYRKAVLLS